MSPLLAQAQRSCSGSLKVDEVLALTDNMLDLFCRVGSSHALATSSPSFAAVRSVAALPHTLTPRALRYEANIVCAGLRFVLQFALHGFGVRVPDFASRGIESGCRAPTHGVRLFVKCKIKS